MATPQETALEFLLAHVARHGDGVASVQAEAHLSALPHSVAQREKEAAEAKKTAVAEEKATAKTEAPPVAAKH